MHDAPTWCSLGKVDVWCPTLTSEEAISRIWTCDLTLFTYNKWLEEKNMFHQIVSLEVPLVYIIHTIWLLWILTGMAIEQNGESGVAFALLVCTLTKDNVSLGFGLGKLGMKILDSTPSQWVRGSLEGTHPTPFF